MGRRTLTAPELAAATASGSRLAREALAEPREGTILSVIAAFASAFQAAAANGSRDFRSSFAAGLARARRALEETPQQLAVLRSAGVVDAGALGFVDLLEGWWRAEGRPIDVVNAGTEGYSTDQEVAWLLEHGAALEPDLVLVLPYENDLYWNGRPDYYGDPKALFRADGSLESGDLPVARERPLLERTALGRLLKGRPAPDVFVPPGHDRPSLKEWGPLLDPLPDFMGDALARTRRAFTEQALRTLCLFPAMNGVPLDDARVEQVVAEAASHDGAAVFVHCGVLSVGVRRKLGLPSRFEQTSSRIGTEIPHTARKCPGASSPHSPASLSAILPPIENPTKNSGVGASCSTTPRRSTVNPE